MYLTERLSDLETERKRLEESAILRLKARRADIIVEQEYTKPLKPRRGDIISLERSEGRCQRSAKEKD